MKLNKRAQGRWQYLLNQTEVELLQSLLKRFPFDEQAPVKITKADRDPKAAEREGLLNESLAEHRKELKKQAAKLVGAGKLEPSGKTHLLMLTADEREILLQILNDIRIGCWVALGKPEILEPKTPDASVLEFARFSLMNLAGYFEHHLIDHEL